MSESELFEDVFMDGGMPVVVCGFCGVTHFATGGRHDDDDVDRLTVLARSEPASYIAHADCDAIALGELEGRTYVPECGTPACRDRAEQIERFIWEHRRKILEYLRRRTAAERDASDRDALAVRATTPECSHGTKAEND